MIYGEDKHKRLMERLGHRHRTIGHGSSLSRRRFFEILGSGVTGSYLAGPMLASENTRPQVSLINKAKSVIFILCVGAPSHVDTFDLKVTEGVTPSDFQPTNVNGIDWPMGLLPKIATVLPHLAIVRSVRSWALVHSLAQVWSQIGRNPVAALGDVSPNMGSVVAVEKESERTASQVFPTFIALNANSAVSQGYLSARYAPFKVIPASTGLNNTANADGQTRLDSRLKFLHSIDDTLRVNSPLSKDLEDYDAFYTSARNMMYNTAVTKAFSYSSADSARYGNSNFGNACLVAKQVLEANQGTRYIQINLNGWDMHEDIYGTAGSADTNIYTLGKNEFDPGVAALIGDLNSNGLLKETLVVIAGEFGRTVGPLSPQGGRDHFMQQFAVFAGAGIKAGRVIGATNADGSDVSEYGWKYNRYIRIEDIEATMYSALGIDWTKQVDTPFGRSYEYVPFAKEGTYAPIDELWA